MLVGILMIVAQGIANITGGKLPVELGIVCNTICVVGVAIIIALHDFKESVEKKK